VACTGLSDALHTLHTTSGRNKPFLSWRNSCISASMKCTRDLPAVAALLALAFVSAPAAAQSVPDEPPSTTGVIHVESARRVMLVDGAYRRIDGGTLVLSCGRHRIGAHREFVLVPCGADVALRDLRRLEENEQVPWEKPPPTVPRDRYERTGGIVLAALGQASLVGGVFAVGNGSACGDYLDGCSKSEVNTGVVLMIAGGIALASGIWLWVHGATQVPATTTSRVGNRSAGVDFFF
jgi:hypothetical protein